MAWLLIALGGEDFFINDFTTSTVNFYILLKVCLRDVVGNASREWDHDLAIDDLIRIIFCPLGVNNIDVRIVSVQCLRHR